MPRTTKKAKSAKAKSTPVDKDPQPTLTEEQAEPKQKPKSDRNTQGQFTKGNSGGPGNPHARSCARMLEVFRNAVSEEQMIRIVNKLVEKAEAGDTSAAKLIVTYRIGKPLPGSHPDSIDRDEWDHYQKDAMKNQEMVAVMNALPTSVGNDIVRVSLPIMTAARTHDLAMQLREGCPAPEAPTPAETDPRDIHEGFSQSEAQHEQSVEVEASDEGKEEKPAPLSNGKKNKKTEQLAATKEPSSNGKTAAKAHTATHDSRIPRSRNHYSHSTTEQPATLHTPPATKNSDGKKMDGKKMKKNKRAAWLQPLAKQLNVQE